VAQAAGRPAGPLHPPKRVAIAEWDSLEKAEAFFKSRHSRKAGDGSKESPGHASALTLYFVWYNFVKLHKAHKLTPALAAGITDKLWSVEDIVALVEASEPKPGKRGPYKKRAAA